MGLALVPWVLLYTDDREKKVPLGYYAVGAYLAWVAVYDSAAVRGWYVPLAMGVVAAPTSLVFVPVLRRVHRLSMLPRTVTVPVVWTACEWLRYEIALAHFDLFALGYSQARFPLLVQVADLTGVYGVSFLVALINGFLADLLFAFRDGGWKSGTVLRSRRIAWSATGVLAALLAVLGYGWFRLSTVRETEGPSVALVQPDVRHAMGQAHGAQLSQVLLTERDVPAGAADLIVWPENAILDYVGSGGACFEDIGWLGHQKGAALLVGGLERAAGVPGRAHNVAVLVDPQGRVLGAHRKRLLFAWTEYLPFDEFLEWGCPPVHRWYRSLVRQVWGGSGIYVPGERSELLQLPWRGGELPFGVALCHEHMYPPIASEMGRLGPRFIVNPTSEGSVGGPIQEQMLRISMLRAIENRVAYVRCGNSGISGIVDAEGRVRSLLRGARGRTILDAGVLIAEVPLSPGGVTPYARSHDAFAKGLTLLSLLLLVPLRRLRRAGSTSVDSPGSSP